MFAQRSRRPSRWAYVLPAVIALVLGVWLGGHDGWMPSPVRRAFVASSSHDQIIDDVLGLLQHDYYRPVSRTQLVDTGLQAAVASLNDPYSHYFDPSTYKLFENETSPHLSGVGIDIDPERRGLLVLNVFPGSPAAKAGLGRGDMITAVDSVSLAGRSAGFAQQHITGPAGTKVTLTVHSRRATREVTLVRADLSVPVAGGRILHYHGRRLGYVYLNSFTSGCGQQVRYWVGQVLKQGVQGLIFDLRENGGGLLNEAVNVASVFIQHGVVVSTRGRAQPSIVYYAKGDAIAPTIPMVVLVDHGTASAAEIVTAALQDHSRAKVVGTHTYGKGVFQEIDPLPNGGALDFTVGEFFTPDGRNLGGGGVKRGAGVTPNVYGYTSPSGTGPALGIAEKTVAAEIR